jgi:ligand-binding sensor domain-containing protein
MILLLALCSSGQAERLPLKNYSIADGLASDSVLRIKRDSHGFLWFCTVDGLSRFDGYRFTNYTTAHGLPDRVVVDLLETRGGAYWVATNRGLVLFNPAGTPAPADATPQPAEPMFRVLYPDWAGPGIVISRLLEDRHATLWVGTNVGVLRLEQQGTHVQFHLEEMGMPNTNIDERDINCLLEDRHGSLWVGTGGSGVYRRWPDGRVERYTARQGIPGGGAVAMLEDREGRLWMADNDGLWRMNPDAGPDHKAVTRIYKPQQNDGLVFSKDLLQTSDGRLWIASDSGLAEFFPEADDVRFQSWTMKNGLQHDKAMALAEDSEGNLWVGTGGGGGHRLARNGFTLFGEEDGIQFGKVSAMFADQQGTLWLVNNANRYLHRLDGRAWTTIRPYRPAAMKHLGWGSHQITFQSRTGEWWIASGEGIYRFPAVARGRFSPYETAGGLH